MTNKSYIQHMPKIELHCHLDGSLPPATILKLAKARNIAVPKDVVSLQKLISVSGSCRSLTEYLSCFELVVSTLQTIENLYQAAFDLLMEVAKENVVYIEIRFAPLLHTRSGLPLDSIVESVIQGAEAAKSRCGISYGIILCAMRHHSFDTNIQLLRVTEKFLNYGVVALDLAGDEKAFSTSAHMELFRQAQKRDIPFTIHAGEADGPGSIETAIAFGAKRIGHGIAMKDSPTTMRLCREKGIGIEMCPTSNLQTKTVSGWGEYPFRLFMDNNILITINTDNRTVSRTTLTQEFNALTAAYQLHTQEVETLYRNAASVTFLDERQKQRLNGIYDDFLVMHDTCC